MVTTCKNQRLEKVKEIEEQMKLLQKDPQANFNTDYKNSIEELSAKDGLGKVYGQPRRFAQERLRSEMTKCEEAQKSIEKLLNKLQELCEQASSGYHEDFDYSKEKHSLSIKIRINLVSLVRMMIHYGKHIGGFKNEPGPEDLERISYLEL